MASKITISCWDTDYKCCRACHEDWEWDLVRDPWFTTETDDYIAQGCCGFDEWIKDKWERYLQEN